MKKFPVHKNIPKVPTLFGLPMQAGGLFFGISVGNAILFIFLPVHPLFKLGGIVIIPVILYLGMLVFFNRYSFESFYKSFHATSIRAVKNKSLAVFTHDRAN